MREGWICPKCQAALSPDVKRCDCNKAGTFGIPMPYYLPQPQLSPDCGCSPGTICMNTACPRAMRITC